MGSKKRLRKQFEVPKRQWNKERIEREGKLRSEYGLKNARELWRMQTILKKIRREARRLLAGRGADTASRQARLLKRVNRFLIRKVDLTLDEVLSLEDRDILERRLQSLVIKKHLATTPRQARQFITHGHICIDGQRVSAPSYLVRFDEEDKIGWFEHAIVIKSNARQEEPEENTNQGPASVAGATSAPTHHAKPAHTASSQPATPAAVTVTPAQATPLAPQTQ